MTDADKMKAMFAADQATHANLVRVAFWLTDSLVKAKAYVNDGDRSIWPNNETYNLWNQTVREPVRIKYITLLSNYNARNVAYRKQPQSLWKIATDSVSQSFQNIYDSIKNFLGISGIGVNGIGDVSKIYQALIWLGGPIVALISSFFTSSQEDSSGAAALAQQLATTDPETALKMAQIAANEKAAIEEAKAKTGLFAQIGSGLKIVVIGGGLFLIGRYGIYPMLGQKKKKK